MKWKNEVIKNNKDFWNGSFGLILPLSLRSTVRAETSDQVTLSVARPGAGYVITKRK